MNVKYFTEYRVLLFIELRQRFYRQPLSKGNLPMGTGTGNQPNQNVLGTNLIRMF